MNELTKVMKKPPRLVSIALLGLITLYTAFEQSSWLFFWMAACVIYWGRSLNLLSDICSERFEVRRPIPRLFVWFSMLFALMWGPTVLTDYFWASIEPQRWIWFGVQFAWVVMLSNSIQFAESRRVSWLLAITHGLLASVWSMPLLLKSFLGDIYGSNSWTIVIVSAVLPQFLALFVATNYVKKTAPKPKADMTEIPYHAFAALTRWKQQQQQTMKGHTALAVTLVALLVGTPVFYFGFQNIRALERIVRGQPIEPVQVHRKDGGALLVENPVEDHSDSKPVSGWNSGQEPKKETAAVSWLTETKADYVTTTLITQGFFAILLGLSLFVTSKPTHLQLSAEGIRFLWRRGWFLKTGRWIEWGKLKSISMQDPDDKPKLCLTEKDGLVHKIDMGCVTSVEEREEILTAMQKFAPNVPREASVIQVLQPPADHSYTELWLQALAAPPKRERLQPLTDGVTLRSGRYKVLSELGSGGQGQAYLCEDLFSNSGDARRRPPQVVLKEFILPVYVDTKVRRTALEQFENEARILRQLDHPQVVKLIDFFIEDHRGYLVLEHIDGASLRKIVETDGLLMEEQVRSLAVQMCDILIYLHNLPEPVVHRDFTPENLILRSDGTLKLIDFNVAKQIVESTVSGTVVGKHAYLPPEQFRGMPETRSDIYAMGATLHFLLTGMDPEPISVSHPKKILSSISEELDSIISRATALDAQQRYARAEEIKEQISALTEPYEVIYVPSEDQRRDREPEDEVPAVRQAHTKAREVRGND